ncbi:uncharacterized protein LOC110635531 isoform X2 [Hevea brasiliensis]|uniref:uncharacterized protein LOC110635531 isoform X2 n=1 Tax=Hevea brasiliensis TaxID=3981 RepID=UPI0025F07E8B|nr:uncharacterized protein LOC110635531 isoform X2 [Hevea brasiliensis]
MGGKNQGNYTIPCLTLHQPWASLLVHGIKRVEGRSWPASVRASKVPDTATIKAMEDFYREIYAVDGISDLKFPEHYPVSKLLGCVELVGCIKCEELVCWEGLPEGVKLEGQTDFCWLCEEPRKLVVPIEMRGYQRIYNLERKIYEEAVRGLCPIEAPSPVKFPLPDPQDPLSLKPGFLASNHDCSKITKVAESRSLDAAIAGSQAAAAQFSKKRSFRYSAIQEEDMPVSTRTRNKIKEEMLGNE